MQNTLWPCQIRPARTLIVRPSSKTISIRTYAGATNSLRCWRPHQLTGPVGQHLQQPQRGSICTQAVAAAGGLCDNVVAVMSGLAAWPWWALAFVMLAGMVLGLAISKLATSYVRKQVDPDASSLENAALRTKVEELQQLLVKLEPLAYKSMQLRFTKGINKSVILGMVDQMLANKEVNIWWLPDQLERLIYFNMMTLMLSVLDEVVDGMSISFAGHNVKLSLAYLDVERGEGVNPNVTAKTEALLRSALEPPKAQQA